MNELKFNSQVCTTKIQSQRLLELGLKPETADMVLFKTYDLPQYPFDYTFNQDPSSLNKIRYVPTIKEEQPFVQDGNIHAWSLHRLIELCPETIEEICNDGEAHCSLHIDFDKHRNIYNNIIDYIDWLIKKGYFNKEYLKQ